MSSPRPDEELMSFETLMKLPLEELNEVKALGSRLAETLDRLEQVLERIEERSPSLEMGAVLRAKRAEFIAQEKEKLAAERKQNQAEIDTLDHVIAIKSGQLN